MFRDDSWFVFNVLPSNFRSCFLQTEMPRWKIQSWCRISVWHLSRRTILHEWLWSNTPNWVQSRNLQSTRSWNLSCMSPGDTFTYRGIFLLPLPSRAHMQWPQRVPCSLFLYRVLEQWWWGRNGGPVLKLVHKTYLIKWWSSCQVVYPEMFLGPVTRVFSQMRDKALRTGRWIANFDVTVCKTSHYCTVSLK